jgi:hypothetical protein
MATQPAHPDNVAVLRGPPESLSDLRFGYFATI